MVRDRTLAEDLAQEAFIRAFNAIRSYDSSYKFSNWIFKIANNHTIDHLRKKKLDTVSIHGSPHATSDEEINRVVRYWKGARVTAQASAAPLEQGQLPLAGVQAQQADADTPAADPVIHKVPPMPAGAEPPLFEQIDALKATLSAMMKANGEADKERKRGQHEAIERGPQSHQALRRLP